MSFPPFAIHVRGKANHINNPVANNFWGKDDAGVSPMLERMHNSKVACDELKAFYNGVSYRFLWTCQFELF